MPLTLTSHLATRPIVHLAARLAPAAPPRAARRVIPRGRPGCASLCAGSRAAD
ncbi:hypothetical protein [Nonomuraea sp. NPDC001831]|uniref:hypothetical protein n=1 Tax=Nonomuraea sp. NPDC001831 TaxID=3364340 RepID=UPI00369B53F5